MEFVVDASVVVKWFLPESHSDKADALLQRFISDGLELTAPDHLIAEVGNTLWKRSVRRKEISVAEADESYSDFLSLQLPLEASSAIAEKAFNLAVLENHSVHDTLYLALALERSCELITADKKFTNKVNKRFPFVRLLDTL